MNIFKRKEDRFDYQLERSCITCHTSFAGRFCPKCGEKVIEPKDRSFKFFINGLLNAYTFIDGKFFRSLKTLITQPGLLSTDIAVGKRQPYMKPIGFFFVANFIYFFFPVFETFNTTLDAQLTMMPYSEFATTLISEKYPDFESNNFKLAYANASTSWSKLLLVLLIPLFFCFVVVINHTNGKYLADHMVYAIELVSYILFVPTILYGLTLLSIIQIAKWLGFNLYFLFYDQNTIWFLVALLLYFLLRSIKRFYHFTWWRVCLSSALLFIAAAIVITVYRFILFLVTMVNL